MFRENKLYIYCDGSCLSSPRRGGVGVRYIQVDREGIEHRYDHQDFGYKGCTNQEMELHACIEGLRHSQKYKFDVEYDSIEIRTDSRYVVEFKNHAIFKWPKQGWLNKDRRPIENVQQWKDLVRWIKKIKLKVDIEWVQGHSTDMDNRAVDRMAKEAAQYAFNPPLKISTPRRKLTNESVQIGSIKNVGQRISIKIITSYPLNEQKLAKYRCEVISKRSKYYGNVDFIYADETIDIRAYHSYVVTLNKEVGNPRIVRVIKEIEKNK